MGMRVHFSGKLLSFFGGCGSILLAQDIHFSQFYSVPMNLNPAMTGFMPDCYRVGAVGRMQWNTFMESYRTVALFAEKKFLENQVGDNAFVGGGLTLYHDRSGPAPFQTNVARLSGAYLKGLGSSLFLSGGFSVDMVNKSFGDGVLYFPDQYTEGIGFDPTSPANEQRYLQSVSYVNVNAGVLVAGYLTDEISGYLGFATFNLLAPQESYLPYSSASTAELQYPRRFVVHGGVSYMMSDFVRVIPNFMVFLQRGAREILFGGSVEYSPSTLMFLSGGLMYRWDDAWILTAGVKYQGITVGIAADFNIGRTGNVTPLTRGWAGIELLLRYEGVCSQLLQLLQTVPCPRL